MTWGKSFIVLTGRFRSTRSSFAAIKGEGGRWGLTVSVPVRVEEVSRCRMAKLVVEWRVWATCKRR